MKLVNEIEKLGLTQLRKKHFKKISSYFIFSLILILNISCITVGIYNASKKGDLVTTQKFIANGVSVNEPDSWGIYPLHYAAEKGHLEIAKLLIENGASVHVLDVREYTPLHFAAKEGRSEMVQYLLTKGANKELKSSTTAYERTPLDLAVMGNHEETMQVLYNWIIIEEIPKDVKTQTTFKGIYKDIVTLRSGDILENVKAVINRNSVLVTNAKGKATEYKKADVKKISFRKI